MLLKRKAHAVQAAAVVGLEDPLPFPLTLTLHPHVPQAPSTAC